MCVSDSSTNGICNEQDRGTKSRRIDEPAGKLCRKESRAKKCLFMEYRAMLMVRVRGEREEVLAILPFCRVSDCRGRLSAGSGMHTSGWRVYRSC